MTLAVLVASVMVPGLMLLVNEGTPNIDELEGGISGRPMSGWINDVQTHSGGGHDAWPTILSDGDRVYAAFSRFDGGIGSYRIAVVESADGGLTWSQIGDLSPGPNDCVYPVMTVYSGALYVSFQYNASASDHDIYCYQGPLGAAGPWTLYDVRTDSNDDLRPTMKAVTITNYPGVYVVFENHRGDPNGTDLVMYKSTGGAFSFVKTVIGTDDPSEYTHADMCIYQDQIIPIIYLAFQKLEGGQNDIYFIRTLNGGTSWSSQYQVTSSLNDEYAPSASADFMFLLISYVVWDSDPDVYAIVWDGANFGTPSPLSANIGYEGWPKAHNWLDDFYVFYPRGLSYTDAQLYVRSASGSLNPAWSYPMLVSDEGAAADAIYRPGLALSERPNGQLYFAVTWGDYRSGLGDSDVYYTTQGCRYTVRTEPLGVTYYVDDMAYSSEQTFNWPAGIQHTLTASPDSFVCWYDGTSQWYTLTITPYAPTNDVTMVAYYTAIPEFSHIALPIFGMASLVVFLRTVGGHRLRAQ